MRPLNENEKEITRKTAQRGSAGAIALEAVLDTAMVQYKVVESTKTTVCILVTDPIVTLDFGLNTAMVGTSKFNIRDKRFDLKIGESLAFRRALG